MIRVCFVCTGNICRSPTAHGIMEVLVKEHHLQNEVQVFSSGTEGYHIGEMADPRSRSMAESRGVPLHSRAEQFQVLDFDRFDYILAMDRSHKSKLKRLARTQEDRQKIHTFLDFDPHSPNDLDVPDPYYGGEQGFVDVYDLCHAGCVGLLEHLQKEHGLAGG